MAHLHNFNHNKSPGLVQTIGSKVKSAAEFLGAVKGIWDFGKSVYSVVGPALTTAAVLV